MLRPVFKIDASGDGKSSACVVPSLMHWELIFCWLLERAQATPLSVISGYLCLK